MTSDMIKAGSVKKALIIGAERLSLAMDWNKRESCFLFGDGAGAVVIEASEKAGLFGYHMGCVPDSRECLRIPNWGLSPDRFTETIPISLDFEGQEIFKSAVKGMGEAIEKVLNQQGIAADDIDLFIPHQPNIRIIQALAKRLNFPMEKVVVCIEQYANTSAAAIPLALCDALEAGRVKPGALILTASFGAGLTYSVGILRWGDSVTPKGRASTVIPPFKGTVFDLMADSFEHHGVDASHLLSGEGQAES